MTDYRFAALAGHGLVSPSDVVDLWVREGALSLERAEARVKEVLAVATSPDGELAGMSTVYVEYNQQLRMDAWHFRTYVGSEHRRHNLGRLFLRHARDELSRRFASGEDRRAAAIVYVLQHAGVNRTRTEAISPNSGFAYIGDNGRGAQVRVFFLPGALAPLPEAAVA
jgi:GNAT superfamily N-acetyltransferase